MSIREEFLKVKEDYEVRAKADRETLSQRIEGFAGFLPNSLKSAKEDLKETGRFYPLFLETSTKVLRPIDFEADTVRALPGFKKLAAFCKDPGNDVAFKVSVTNLKGKELGVGCFMVEREANIRIDIDPMKPYAESKISIGVDSYKGGKDRSWTPAASCQIKTPKP